MLTDLPFCLQKMRVLLVCYCSLLYRGLQCVILSFGTKGAYYSHRKTAKNGNTAWHSLSFNSNLKVLKVLIHVSPCLFMSLSKQIFSLTSSFYCGFLFPWEVSNPLLLSVDCLLDSVCHICTPLAASPLACNSILNNPPTGMFVARTAKNSCYASKISSFQHSSKGSIIQRFRYPSQGSSNGSKTQRFKVPSDNSTIHRFQDSETPKLQDSKNRYLYRHTISLRRPSSPCIC